MKRQSKRVRAFKVGEGLPSLTELRAELQDMTDVLLGRKDPPINKGQFTLMEVAEAYYARGMEVTMLLHKLEAEGHVIRGSNHYKFRTGELRDFTDLAKSAAELGSRRVTWEQLVFNQAMRGLEA